MTDIKQGTYNQIKNKSPILSFFNSQTGFLVILVILFVSVVGLLNPNFFHLQNLINLIQQNVTLGIIIVGVGLLTITGNFDISVGTMLSLITVVVSEVIIITNNAFLASLVGIIMGSLLGLLNGVVVAKTKAPSFIITLGFLLIYRAFALIISGGIEYAFKGKYSWLGQGKIGYYLPISVLILILIFILGYIILRFTKFGRMLYVIGGNEKAAFISGINVDLYKILVYGICGTLVGLGTLVLVSRLGVGFPNSGEKYALDAMAAVVVGGVSLYGGKGSALSFVLGTLIFALITNALNLISVNPYWRDAVVGAVMILAVTIGQVGQSRQK